MFIGVSLSALLLDYFLYKKVVGRSASPKQYAKSFTWWLDYVQKNDVFTKWIKGELI